jgi:hypothetical protein
MTMNPVGRMDQNTSEELIKKFLDNGGEITKCPPGARSEGIEYTSGFYNRKKKTTATKETTDENDGED